MIRLHLRGGGLLLSARDNRPKASNDLVSNCEQNEPIPLLPYPPIYPRKKAFTLAEVLIVLAVIGVVAALTIPTLLKSWDTNRWSTADDVFKNRLTQAVSQMHARGKLTNLNSTQKFIEELQHYMKIVKTCDNDHLNECFSENIDETAFNAESFKTSNAFGQTWNSQTWGVKLANGANMLIAYNPNCTLDPAATGPEVATCSVAAIYDTNGDTSPNVTDGTKDIRKFNVVNKTVCTKGVRLGDICVSSADVNYDYLDLTNDTEDMKYDMSCENCPHPVNHSWCQSSYCRYNYWAGAKKACDLLDMRLPTQAEWDTILSHKDKLGLYVDPPLLFPWASDTRGYWLEDGTSSPTSVMSADYWISGNQYACQANGKSSMNKNLRCVE